MYFNKKLMKPLMGHTMVVNVQYYFLSLDLILKWITRDNRLIVDI